MNDDPLAATGMPRGYDLLIRHLKERAVKLGEFALAMVHDGWRAYSESDSAAAQDVLNRAEQLDRMDEDMEHASIAFLVLRQPTAIDLRTAAALLKITTHLDRMGRLGFDMARMTFPDDDKVPAELDEIHRHLQAMDDDVESMVRQSLDALDRDQVDLARQLFRRDDAVDRMHREANRSIVAALEQHPDFAQRLAMDLLAARHFERIADNACKVGEKTIYALTGMRRSEYLPRHPFHPYATEALPSEPPRRSK